MIHLVFKSCLKFQNLFILRKCFFTQRIQTLYNLLVPDVFRRNLILGTLVKLIFLVRHLGIFPYSHTFRKLLCPRHHMVFHFLQNRVNITFLNPAEGVLSVALPIVYLHHISLFHKHIRTDINALSGNGIILPL